MIERGAEDRHHGHLVRGVRLGILAMAFGIGVAAYAASSLQAPAAEGADDLRSQRFWLAFFREGMAADTYDSLEALTNASDLVVVGRIKGIAMGRDFLADPSFDDTTFFLATITVLVDDVVKGSLISSEPNELKLEVYVGNGSPGTVPRRFDEAADNLPRERTMFLLTNIGEEALSEGYEKSSEWSDETYYRLASESQAYFRDFGSAGTPVAAEDPWVLALGSKDFGSVVERVRSLGRH